jgi:hypothetical protein
MDPHHLGSRGYANKMNEFQAKLDDLQQCGIVPQTANWEPRLLSYVMARGHATARTGA